MKNNRLLVLLIISFVLMVVTKQVCGRIYRAQISPPVSKEELGLTQKRAEVYFTMSDAMGAEALVEDDCPDGEHTHTDDCAYGGDKPCGCKAVSGGVDLILNEEEGDEHHHHHHHHHHHADEEGKDPTVSPGLVILLKQLGFAELAANLLWVQMDADSHREMWHRVDFALDLIPVLDPTFLEAYLLKSFFLDTYRNRHEEALDVLERAVKTVANRMELWQQIGVLTLNHGGRHGDTRNLPRALEAFEILNSFSNPPVYAIRLKAVTLAAMERRSEAIALLEGALNDGKREEKQKTIDLNMINRIKDGEKF